MTRSFNEVEGRTRSFNEFKSVMFKGFFRMCHDVSRCDKMFQIQGKTRVFKVFKRCDNVF